MRGHIKIPLEHAQFGDIVRYRDPVTYGVHNRILVQVFHGQMTTLMLAPHVICTDAGYYLLGNVTGPDQQEHKMVIDSSIVIGIYRSLTEPHVNQVARTVPQTVYHAAYSSEAA